MYKSEKKFEKKISEPRQFWKRLAILTEAYNFTRSYTPQYEELFRIKPIIQKIPENPERFWSTYPFRKELEKFKERLNGFNRRLELIQGEKRSKVERIEY